MNMKLLILLTKGFLRNKKFLIAIFIISSMSMISILSFSYMSITASEISKQTAESDCGRFDVIIENISNTKIDEIEKAEGVVDSCRFGEYSFSENSISINFITAPEEYLEFSSYQLIDGVYPSAENEILCEPWILRQKGIQSDEMIGNLVEFNGSKYIVTGLIFDAGYAIAQEPVASVISIENSATTNGIMINVKGKIELYDFDNLYNIIGTTDEVIIGRNTAKETALQNANTSTNSIIFFVLMIIFICSITIIANGVNLYISKCKKTISTYSSIGIGGGMIFTSIILIVFLIIVLSNSASFILFMLCKNVISSANINSRELVREIVTILMQITFLELLTILLVVFRIFSKRFFVSKIEGYEIKSRVSNRKKSKHIFSTLARNNLKIFIKVNIFTVLAIAFSAIAFVSIFFYIDLYRSTSIDYGDTKYIINLTDDIFLSEEQIEQKSEIVDKVLKDKTFNARTQNIFYTTIQIDKNQISADFKDYLSNYTAYHAAFKNKLTKQVSISVGIMAFSELVEFEGTVSDDECILYNKPLNLGVKNGLNSNVINIKIEAQSLNTLKQLNTIIINKSFPQQIYTNQVLFMIVVSDKTFSEISNNQTADCIYINSNVKEGVLLDYLKGNSFARLQNEYLDKQTINKNISYIKVILGALALISLSVVVINLMATCIIRLIIFQKEYAILNAIGISFSTIFKIPLYELTFLYVPIMIISWIGSFISTKIIVFLSPEETNSFYKYPFSLLFSLSAVILIAMVFSLILILKSIKKRIKKNRNVFS